MSYQARKLVITHPDGSGREFLPQQSTITIGRVTGNDVVIDYINVSRRQCTLHFDGDGVRVTDDRSTGGTFVDGCRIGDGVQLTTDSAITFGGTSIRVVPR